MIGFGKVLFYITEDIGNKGTLTEVFMERLIESTTNGLKPVNLTAHSRGERARRISNENSEILEAVKNSTLGRLLRNDEMVVISIKRTTALKFETNSLNQQETRLFLEGLLDPKNDHSFGDRETKIIEYLLRNFHRSGQWWHGLTEEEGTTSQIVKRIVKRAEIKNFVNTRFQDVLRSKTRGRIMARTRIISESEAVNNSEKTGLEILVGKTVDLGVVG